MRPTRADAIVLGLAALAAGVVAWGSAPLAGVARALGAFALVVGAERATRDLVPEIARAAAALGASGVSIAIAQAHDVRTLLALGAAAIAIAAWRSEGIPTRAWSAVALAGVAQLLDPSIGAVTVALLVWVGPVDRARSIVLVALPFARWPLAIADSGIAAAIVLATGLVSRFLRVPIERAPLREGGQRSLLTLALLLPGLALAGAVLLGATPGALVLAAGAGTAIAIAILGLTVVLATTSPLRVMVVGALVLPVVTAALDAASLTMLALALTSCVAVGTAALARAIASWRAAAGAAPGPGPF